MYKRQDQAFFGAPLVNFPPLGLDYIEWYIAQLPFADELEASEVHAWFVEAAHRPEVLGAAVDEIVFDFEASPGSYAQRLRSGIRRQIDSARQEALRVVHSLTPLQASVLRVMAESGAEYAPFESRSMQRYRAQMQQIAPGSPIDPDTTNVQQALAALQDKALVWRAARGIYALEDTFLAELMRAAGMISGPAGAQEPL